MELKEFFSKQYNEWQGFRMRVDQLAQVETKVFDMGGYTVIAQYNPARAISTGAKVDAQSIANRKCFLCDENRPSEQEKIAITENFSLLVNPFPILKGHFTLPYNGHEPQEIDGHIDEFLQICEQMPDYTIFYNGPESGASAPDHLHFQAVERGQLPLENELNKIHTREISEWNGDTMEELLNFGRKCIHMESKKAEKVVSFFKQLYKQYQMLSGSDKKEPRMNLFGYYEEETYHLFLFPRKTHRPSQYFEEGDGNRLISPGAIDMAGVIVVPRKKDFDEMTAELIQDIYRQVGY